MAKRYKKYKNLIKTATKNVKPVLTKDEQLYRNILILSGIKNSNKDLIRKAVRNIK